MQESTTKLLTDALNAMIDTLYLTLVDSVK